MRGPIVYCFEGVDNGDKLQELHVKRDVEIMVGEYDPEILRGIVPLKMKGMRIYANDSLYFEGDLLQKEEILTAVPYYSWGNRGLTQMRVWMHEY